MANINVVVDKPIADGYKLKFRTPCDSTTIEGLEVKYPANNGVGTLIKKFVFKDAHGTELSGVGNLFVSGVMIEVLLDVTHGVAYIQNADTNSYVESVKSEVQRLEENQKQFLGVVGKAVEECERVAAETTSAIEATKEATNELVLTHEEFVSGGYVEALKELNDGNKFTFWVGTTDEYNALPEKVNNCFYILTDDANRNEILSQIEDLQSEITSANDNISDLLIDLETTKGNVTTLQVQIETAQISISGLQSGLENTNDMLINVGGQFGPVNEQLTNLSNCVGNVTSPLWNTLYRDHSAGITVSEMLKGGVPVDKINEYSFVVFGVSIRNSVDGKTAFCYTAPAVRFDYGDGMGRFNAVIPFITGGVTSLEVKYEGKYLTGMNYDPTHELGDTIILKEIIGIM